ncbi:peroxisomal membrane protein 11A isoform X1 [Anas platyrhynchos]|uniref:peroxisomal membrane protein 11A isoform X1 n=1 Tax=Anas platyrhynchos TaxID=8839 RepID=UPI003AF26F0D
MAEESPGNASGHARASCCLSQCRAQHRCSNHSRCRRTKNRTISTFMRATQYTCMLLGYVLQRQAEKEELVLKLKQLEASMSSGRKMFRLGNTVHALVAARRTTQLPDVVPRVCLTASNLTRALYFVCDTVLWLKSVGLQPDIDVPKWRNWATKCYYFSLLMNLARDWYEVSWRLEQAVQEGKMKENSSRDKRNHELNGLKCDGVHGFFLLLFQILKNHPPLVLDMVKNLCDLTGPLDTLGIYKTNPGVIGFCGLLSSLVGILTLASPHLKLKQ